MFVCSSSISLGLGGSGSLAELCEHEVEEVSKVCEVFEESDVTTSPFVSIWL